MFNFFKRQQQTAQAVALTIVQTNIVSCWRKCLNEECGSNPEARISTLMFKWGWEGVALRFLKESYIIQFDQKSSGLEERLSGYLTYVDSTILQYGYKYKQEELEQIGELFAVASVLGLDHAITSNPERADIIFDVLPASWLNVIKLDATKFNSLYLKYTGKVRTSRTDTRLREAGRADSTEQVLTRPFRIVHVDDEDFTLTFVERLINDRFSNVLLDKFENGDDAWNALRMIEPDLLITDLLNNNVPGRTRSFGKSGFELLNLLSKLHIKYPILIFSGSFAKEGFEARARQCAGTILNVSCLGKPSTSEQLYFELEKHVRTPSIKVNRIAFSEAENQIMRDYGSLITLPIEVQNTVANLYYESCCNGLDVNTRFPRLAPIVKKMCEAFAKPAPDDGSSTYIIEVFLAMYKYRIPNVLDKTLAELHAEKEYYSKSVSEIPDLWKYF